MDLLEIGIEVLKHGGYFFAIVSRQVQSCITMLKALMAATPFTKELLQHRDLIGEIRVIHFMVKQQ